MNAIALLSPKDSISYHSFFKTDLSLKKRHKESLASWVPHPYLQHLHISSESLARGEAMLFILASNVTLKELLPQLRKSQGF